MVARSCWLAASSMSTGDDLAFADAVPIESTEISANVAWPHHFRATILRVEESRKSRPRSRHIPKTWRGRWGPYLPSTFWSRESVRYDRRRAWSLGRPLGKVRYSIVHFYTCA